MPKIDFTEEERAALADLAREYVRTQRYPLSAAAGADQGGLEEAGAKRRAAEIAGSEEGAKGRVAVAADRQI